MPLLNNVSIQSKQKLLKQNEVLPRQPAGGAEFRAFCVPLVYVHLENSSILSRDHVRWSHWSTDESLPVQKNTLNFFNTTLCAFRRDFSMSFKLFNICVFLSVFLQPLLYTRVMFSQVFKFGNKQKEGQKQQDMSHKQKPCMKHIKTILAFNFKT